MVGICAFMAITLMRRYGGLLLFDVDTFSVVEKLSAGSILNDENFLIYV